MDSLTDAANDGAATTHVPANGNAAANVPSLDGPVIRDATADERSECWRGSQPNANDGRLPDDAKHRICKHGNAWNANC